MAKVGKILLIVGLVLALVGFAGGVGSIVYGVQAATNLVRTSAIGAASASVTSEAGVEWDVFGESADYVECEAWGPSGEPVELTWATSTLNLDVDNTTMRRHASFSATVAGEYSVQCEPQMGVVRLVDSAAMSRTLGWLIASPFLFVGGVLGVGLAALGLILWLVGRSRNRTPGAGQPRAPGPWGSGPPPPGQPSGGPPPAAPPRR